MPEHLSPQQLEQHYARTLRPEELVAVDEHLAACDACQRQFSVLARLPSNASPLRLDLSAADEAPAHLLYEEQLVPYVDGNLSAVEREIVDGHLSVCEMCSAEARDLEEFKAALAAPASVKTLTDVRPRPRRRLLDLWRLSSRWAVAACAVALIAFALLAALLFRRAPSRGDETQVAQSEHPSAASETGTQAVGEPTPNPTPERSEEMTGTDKTGAASSSEQANKSQPPNAPRDNQPEISRSNLVALNDGGGRVMLDEKGNLIGLSDLAPAARRSVREALVRRNLPQPSTLRELAGNSVKLLDAAPADPASFALVEPVARVVRSERPSFRWRPLSGASTYTVSVFDAQFKRVLTSGPLTTDSWSATSALRRGEVYSWQVTAQRNGEELTAPLAPAPEARFRILGQGEADEIERAERSAPVSHLARGVLYARAGLLEEAEREFQSLAQANPRSTVARKLLRSVQSWRRR